MRQEYVRENLSLQATLKFILTCKLIAVQQTQNIFFKCILSLTENNLSFVVENRKLKEKQLITIVSYVMIEGITKCSKSFKMKAIDL